MTTALCAWESQYALLHFMIFQPACLDQHQTVYSSVIVRTMQSVSLQQENVPVRVKQAHQVRVELPAGTSTGAVLHAKLVIFVVIYLHCYIFIFWRSKNQI